MMTVKEFENIKSKLATLREKKARVEGALERLHAQLKSGFGFDSVDEAKEEIEILKKANEKEERRIEKLESELDAISEWNEEK